MAPGSQMCALALFFLATYVSALAQSDTPTIRTEVKLVNVYVTVVDANGAPVGTLKKEDFSVLEEGQPQDVRVFQRESELPLSIVLTIDASLSTRLLLKEQIESARRFVRAVVRPVDAISIYQFASQVDELVPFTSDMKQVDRGLSRVRSSGATALYDALYLAGQTLEKRQGRKVIVVLSDGGDTLSTVSFKDALRAAQQSEAIVYSIITVPITASAGRNLGGEHALIGLSEASGGKHYFAGSPGELDKIFEQISEELRTQYLLAYYPKQRLEPDFRRIEVRLKDHEGLTARHRSGYYTSNAR